MKYQIPIETSTKKSKEKKDKYRIASKERKTKALFGVTLSVETPGGWILGEIQFHLLAPASIIYQHPYPPRLKHQIPLHLQKTEKILYFALAFVPDHSCIESFLQIRTIFILSVSQ